MIRWIAVLGALSCALSSPVSADPAPPPIVSVEARVGHGLAMGGGPGESSWRQSPVTVSVLGEIAVIAQPWTSIYGGLVVEGLGRASAGIAGGVRVRPGENALRLSAGGVLIAMPTSALGASAAVGTCLGRGIRLCGDVEGVVFFAGGDVPDRRIAAQIQLVLGVAFDAM